MSSALLAFGPPALLACHGLLSHSLLHRFYHGYESYMAYAFPHDDLKPLSFSYTDSLGKLAEQVTEHAFPDACRPIWQLPVVDMAFPKLRSWWCILT